MATKTFDLTGEDVSLGPDQLGEAAKGCSIQTKTRREGLSEGVREIHVNSGAFRYVVLPTRGMGLWKAWLGELEIGWRSPVRGPVHPKFVALAEPGGLGWLDGFDELLVRCGLESNGAPEFEENGTLKYPLHGRVANKPAHKVSASVDSDTGEITITGVVEEARFHFSKLRLTSSLTTGPGEPGVRIHDVVENLSGSDAEAQMLYHVNFGLPLLDAGSRFVAPIKTVVPRNDHAASVIKNWDSYGAQQPDFEEQVYLLELLANKGGQSGILLKNAHGTAGVSMRFDKKKLPCFTVWKNTTSAADGYVTGLEPGTNFPNPRTYEGKQGRVVKLESGGKTSFDLQIEIHDAAAGVEKAEKAIKAIQGNHEPRVFDKPQEGWCAP